MSHVDALKAAIAAEKLAANRYLLLRTPEDLDRYLDARNAVDEIIEGLPQ